jgi:hypothetical protein
LEGEKSVEIVIQQKAEAGAEVVILLDFDVAKSILQFGDEYILKPAVKWVEDSKTGVEGRIQAGLYAEVSVINQEDTLHSFTDIEGNFKITGLEEGVHKVILKIRSLIEKPDMPQELTVENITIIKGEITNMGEIKVGG